MLNKKEKEAIKILKDLNESFEQSAKDGVLTTYTLASGKEYTAAQITDILNTTLNLIEHQNKLINLLASQLATPIYNKEWIINYWTKILNKIEEK